MRKMWMIAIAVTMLTLASSAPLIAGEDHSHHGDPPEISGNVNMVITTGNIFNSALGEDSTATVDVGSILSGNLKGNIDIIISTGDIVNSTVEEDNDASVRIGVIGR